jgi:hypothetical protein
MPRRKPFDLTVTKLRSAITNGTAVLADVDHRSAVMRRLRDLIHLHESDLGGEDAISESERRLVRRAAMLTLQLEMMEAKFAVNDGEATAHQLQVYQQCSNTLRRLLESLGGLKRQPRDVTPVPSLTQYLQRRQTTSEAAE